MLHWLKSPGLSSRRFQQAHCGSGLRHSHRCKYAIWDLTFCRRTRVVHTQRRCRKYLWLFIRRCTQERHTFLKSLIFISSRWCSRRRQSSQTRMVLERFRCQDPVIHKVVHRQCGLLEKSFFDNRLQRFLDLKSQVGAAVHVHSNVPFPTAAYCRAT